MNLNQNYKNIATLLGYKVRALFLDQDDILVGLICSQVGSKTKFKWTPLITTKDAIDIAIKLNFKISFYDTMCRVDFEYVKHRTFWKPKRIKRWSGEHYQSHMWDKEKALRLAILRAAESLYLFKEEQKKC